MALSTYEFTVPSHGGAPKRCSRCSPTPPAGTSGRASSVAVSEWDREGEPAPGGVGAVRKLGRWPCVQP